MEIGVILENIAGLIGLFFELGMAIILMAIKVVLLVTLVYVAILPFLVAAKIHVRRRRQRAQDKAATKGEILQEASPAVPPPEAAALNAALVRFIPTSLINLLEDPETWLLRQFPGGKGKLLVNLLAFLGVITVGLLGMLPTILSFWATHAPDLTNDDEEHGVWIDIKTGDIPKDLNDRDVIEI